MTELEHAFYARKLIGSAEHILKDGSFDLARYQQLAEAVDRDLHDEAWVEQLLAFCATQCGYFARTLGRMVATQIYRDQEAVVADADRLRESYRSAESAMASSTDRLRWAEGIVALFDDRDWAREVYDRIRDAFAEPRARCIARAASSAWIAR